MTTKSAQTEQRKTGFSPLQEAAQKLADYARFQGRYRAKELVGILTSQSERAVRIAQPAVRIHLYIEHGDVNQTPINMRLR